MQLVLALPAVKEGSTTYVQPPKRKSEETNDNKKNSIEHDLQRRGKEIETGNTKTSNEMKILKYSPHVQSDCGMKGDKGKDIVDEIAVETTILPLRAMKDGKLINIKKLKAEGTLTNRNSLIEHDLLGSGEVPMFSPYLQNDYGKEGGNAKGILALPAPKEGSVVDIEKPDGKKEEADNNRISLIEPYLKRSDNKSSAANFTTKNGKKGNNLEEFDEAAESRFKLEMNGPQGDSGEKIDPKLCYDSGRKGDETSTEKIKSKRERRSKKCEPQASNKGNIDPEPSFYGFDIGFDEDKLLTDGKIKSKIQEKIVVEDKLQENDDEAADTSGFKLKMKEPQGDSEEKIDPELCYGNAGKGDEAPTEKIKSKRKRRSKKCEPQANNKEKIDPEPSCYGFDIGFDEDKLLTDGKIKSKVQTKIVVEDKLQENDDEAADTSRFKLKMNEPQGDSEEKIDPKLCYGNAGKGDEAATEKIKSKRKRRSKKCEPQAGDKEKIDPEPSCYGFNVGIGEDKLLEDGKIKSMVQNKVVDDKLQENDDEEAAETSRFKLKMNEPQGDNGEKIDPKLCYDSAGKGDETATEKIKSKQERWSKKCEPQTSNEDKIDPEPSCYGFDIVFGEDMLLTDGKIKSKVQKKVVEDKLQENDDKAAETSRFKLKMNEPRGDSGEKIDPKLCYGSAGEEEETATEKIKSKRRRRSQKCEPQGGNQDKIDHEQSCYSFDIGFGEDKILTDGEIKSKVQKKEVVEDKLQENDDDEAASRFKLKMKEPQGDSGEKIDPKLCYGSAGKEEETATEKIKSKRRRRSKKCEPQAGNKEKIDPEPSCYSFDIGFGEDKILTDGEIKSKVQKKEVVEDKLQENDDDEAASRFKLKMKEPQGDSGEKIDPKLCYGSAGKEEETATEKIKSKRWRRSKRCEPQAGNKEKIDPEPSCYSFDIGFGEDKLLTDGDIKSKVQKEKVVEDKLQENDEAASRFKLKINEHQGDSGEKIDPKLCYGSPGKEEETATEKIKSKRRRRSKKCEPQAGNKEKIDPEPSCDSFDIGFGEDKLLTDGEIKSKVQKKIVVEHKLQENDDDEAAETSRFKLKMNEPQGDSAEKIDPKLCYGSAGKGDEAATEKIKSKRKRRSKKCEPQAGNKDRIDSELCCDGCDTGFIENKQPADGIIKFKEKTKAVEDELPENGDDAESSKFKLLKIGPEIKKNTVQLGVRYVAPSFQNDSAKKILALPTSEDLLGDKVEENGSRVQINQQGQDGCVFSVVLTSPENGNRFESISIKFKKKPIEVSAKVGKANHCSQIDNMKKSVEVEALEHEQGLKGNGNEIETIKVKFTKNRKSNDEKGAEGHE
ncbi:unnamed protein product [Sphenostylis stenocarpa]|uniref:Elongation factor 1 beta central acidic region eukaryote domain-containing protein n=1 Tax=Sphenostylis stenocarpa TaxID=92480 RepID=A0AA86STK5_9FABA|nr:unnamed protein product [Sphenostylis stenocarpa]